MENTNFKDNPKFLIITSVVVPIFISIIGLAGIIAPKLIPTPSMPSESNITDAQKTTAEVKQSSTPTIVANDTYGYLSGNDIVNSITSTIVTLKSNRGPEDFEVQLISNEHYVLGYAKDLNASNLQITPNSSSDYSKKIAVKFKDVISIKAGDSKIKKNNYKVLNINSKSIRTDLNFH